MNSIISRFTLRSTQWESCSIKKTKSSFDEYPSSLRLHYLYAKMSYDISETKIAFPIFYNLIQNKYYVEPILDLFYDYYKSRNKDSALYYSNLYESVFPGRCNINKIFYQIENNQLVHKEDCQKCLKSVSRPDSLKAKVASKL